MNPDIANNTNSTVEASVRKMLFSVGTVNC